MFLQTHGDIPFDKLQPILYELLMLVVQTELLASIMVKVVGADVHIIPFHVVPTAQVAVAVAIAS